MIVFIYLYRVLILPIASVIVNVIYFFMYIGYWKAGKIGLKHFLINLSWITLNYYIEHKKYKPDLLGGTFNFIPTMLQFYVVSGDCSVFARFVYKCLKKLEYKPRLWLIIDGWNIKTCHVVTTVFDGAQWKLYNVRNIITGNSEQELLDRFRTESLVKLGKYDKLRVYKWF